MNRVSLAFFGLLLWTTGCGKPASSDHPPQLNEPLSSHRALEGSLESNLQKILKDEWAEDCDQTWGPKALEMARALDSRKLEIDKLQAAGSTSTVYKAIPLPPTYAREAIGHFEITPGWKEESDSWSDMYQAYLKIKDQPTDRSWILLNARVQANILDDRNRVLNYSNVYLDRNSGPLLEKAEQEVRQCNETPTCTQPSLSPESEAFVKGNLYYNAYWKKIVLATDSAQSRTWIQKFDKRMNADLSDIRFIPNPKVSIKNGELLLPLDPGPFSPSTELLSKTIESIWSSESLKLKIQWVNADATSEIFKLLFGDTPGARSFVLFSKFEVHLFPNVRLRSIAHEIGHVIGFKDHYYTTWHPETCSYVTQSTDEDIMSEPATGSVTPEEWSELKARYSQAASLQ